MTTEEAIKILDPATSSEALRSYGDGSTYKHWRLLEEAQRIACAVLRAQQAPVKLDRSLWKGCSECTVSYNREDWKSGAAHEFRIDEDSLFFFDSQRGWEGIKIKFCPICSKPLTEEAWAELEQRIGGNDGKTD